MPHTTEIAPLKIAVLGAGGGIGQSLSLLLKTSLRDTCITADSRITLALYDVNRDAVAGAATDLSHINTPVTVTWHAPASSGAPAASDSDPLAACLQDARLVVIPAGVPRKPGMTRDDLYSINSRIVTTLARGIAAHCDLSRTFVLLISNPVNSLVPVLVDTLVAGGAPATVARRVFGLTQLDAVRASTFLHAALGCSANEVVHVPVVGGHSGHTIVPLFSQSGTSGGDVERQKLAARAHSLSAATVSQLAYRVQFGGDEVVKAKNGAGSATLSMAYAAAQVTQAFAELLLNLRAEICDTLYVNVGAIAAQIGADAEEQLAQISGGLRYLSVPLRVTEAGVESMQTEWAQHMTEAEQSMWLACVQELQSSVHERGA
ncbi:LANO_0E05182g1_1 [Lachancea nothofagi CBS 11611]|uniref:malate dehydrogenase n=1 Tax=Lachancea nothofagi CBS 11611 TaxID=1266666 RepID=A0A1G4JST1_9SACH|nr:LANO_0E05182g1_1 [Lachancea nothofagi CBS 11611]